MLDLHRGLGALALIFTGVHVAAIMLDSYVPFDRVSTFVPFTASWHPLAIAWGIVGLYLMLAVELTSLARKRLSKRVWRRVHCASFALFATSAIHALTVGTDASTLALQVWIFGCVALVGVLTGTYGRGCSRAVHPRLTCRSRHPGTVGGMETQPSAEGRVTPGAPAPVAARTSSPRPAARPSVPVIGPREGSPRRIALVAHDNKKRDLLDWAHFNREILADHSLFGTGTTGGLVESELGLPVTRFRSGPLGGDQQLGARITEGAIDLVLFFWDPLEPQPHDPDVRALLRIAVVWNVPIACNRATADYLISSPLLDSDYKPSLPDYEIAPPVAVPSIHEAAGRGHTMGGAEVS